MPLFSWRKEEDLPIAMSDSSASAAVHEKSIDESIASNVDSRHADPSAEPPTTTMSLVPTPANETPPPITTMTNDVNVYHDDASEWITTPFTAESYQETIEQNTDYSTFHTNVPSSENELWEYQAGVHTTEHNNNNNTKDDAHDPYSSPPDVSHHHYQVVTLSQPELAVDSFEQFRSLNDYKQQDDATLNNNNALIAVDTSDNHQAMVVHVSSSLSPRLYCTQPSVQEALDKAQEQSLRRKMQLHSRIHQVELHVASIYAALATQECQDETTKVTVQWNNQLQDVLDTLGLEREALKYSRTTWMQLESKVSQLDAKITHSYYVHLQDAVKKKLSHDVVSQKQQQQDTTTTGNRHLYTTLAGRLENLAGTSARRYQEERASRAVAVELARQQMTKLEDVDPALAQTFLQQIRDLRAKLQQERLERQKADKELLEKIVRKTAAMKRAIMEIVKEEEEEQIPLRLLPGISPQMTNKLLTSSSNGKQHSSIIQYKTP